MSGGARGRSAEAYYRHLDKALQALRRVLSSSGKFPQYSQSLGLSLSASGRPQLGRSGISEGRRATAQFRRGLQQSIIGTAYAMELPRFSSLLPSVDYPGAT